MTTAAVTLTPFFLSSPAGKLFALYTTPTHGARRGQILYLPPFAEEMHKSRRMAALQARRFAAAGYAVLQLDLTGCGDSWGDFSAARWEHWLADAACAIQWLKEQNQELPLFIWGLRLGATLAVNVAQHTPIINGLLLWQPIINGDLFLNQFLRLKLASDLLNEGQARTGTRQLREQFQQGLSIEIGGYCLTAELAIAIGELHLERMIPPCPVGWIDVVSELPHAPPPALQKLIQTWQPRGVVIHNQQVIGDPFWVTQEITDCPALFEVTLELIEHIQR